MITDECVKKAYCEALEFAMSLIPADKWSISPSGLLIHSHHGKYGMASPQGEVLIYQGFIGTNATNKLKATILHELAHLCVGLHNHHNRLFKRIERLFCQNLDPCLVERDKDEVISKINYKWQVIAHMADGSAKDLGGVHRKTKRWAEYSAFSSNTRDSIKGIPVLKYEFIENRKN
jgi:hypothetical protein